MPLRLSLILGLASRPQWHSAAAAAATTTTRTRTKTRNGVLAASTYHIRSASILSSLSDNASAYQKRIRRGRGPASGKGKTSGRGQKGQRAHGKVPRGFEGGQTPGWITNPERGRKGGYDPFRVEMSGVNLDRIQAWIDRGRLDASRVITMRELKRSRCVHGVKRHGVKVLARNAEQLTTPIHLVVSRASKEAIARIEAVGGSVTTRFYSPTSIKRVLRGDSHPILSLQAPSSLLSLASEADKAGWKIPASLHNHSSSSSEGAAVERKRMAGILQAVGQQYQFRLPDATSRKDIEYYRDPAHRGYLSHLVKEGETPSLFWRLPRARESVKGQGRKSTTAKEREENKMF